MNIRHHSLILPLALLIVACQPADDEAAMNGAADATADATAAAGLDALRESYEEHYDMGHAEVVAEMYTDSAVALMADGSVLRGREAIAAYLSQVMAGRPDLSLEAIDRVVGGDHAVSVGRWDVTMTPEEGSEPTSAGGHYLAVHQSGADGWKLRAVITNFDAQQSAEMLQGSVPPEPPAEESTMGEVHAAYEAAWNAGDVAAAVGHYADDAWVAAADLPPVEGAEAISNLIEMQIGGTLDIHGVRTVELGDGWFVDGGWYDMSGEEGDYRGNFIVLGRQADGETKIHKMVTNGRPLAVIPSSEAM